MKFFNTLCFIMAIIMFVGIVYFFTLYLDIVVKYYGSVKKVEIYEEVVNKIDKSLGECIDLCKPLIPEEEPEGIEEGGYTKIEIENPIDIPAGFEYCEWIIEDLFGDLFCDISDYDGEDSEIKTVYHNPFLNMVLPIEPSITVEIVQPEPVCINWVFDYWETLDPRKCLNWSE